MRRADGASKSPLAGVAGTAFAGDWRGLDLVKIVDVMRPSGITMEQLLASIKQQTESPL